MSGQEQKAQTKENVIFLDGIGGVLTRITNGKKKKKKKEKAKIKKKRSRVKNDNIALKNNFTVEFGIILNILD